SHTCTQGRALRHPGLRIAQSPETLQLPEALPARRANIPARRAETEATQKICFKFSKQPHNKSPPCL
ncbi:hypothetical protein A2U01_0093972, partial [Trifolium medium]|nr:hypothetical protein [Trifolium medium]